MADVADNFIVIHNKFVVIHNSAAFAIDNLFRLAIAFAVSSRLRGLGAAMRNAICS